MYDTIIIGAGPGGCAAGVYAARKKLKTLLITESFGGQSAVSAEVENWIGDIKLSGFELAQKLEKHLKNYQEIIDIKEGERVVVIRKQKTVNKQQETINKKQLTGNDQQETINSQQETENTSDHEILPRPAQAGRDQDDITTNNKQVFVVETEIGEKFESKTVILAMGGKHRHLNVPGEKEFMGKGVAYCSTCDAPMFRNKSVAVVGSGNSGLEAVVDLLPYAKSIYLIDVLDDIRGDKVLQEQIFANKQVEFIGGAKIKAISGEQFVNNLIYEKDGQENVLALQGVFVEIGMVPNSEIVKDLVELDKFGQVKIDHRTKQTSMPGVYAVGDITDAPFKQNNISAGDGAIATLSVNEYLIKNCTQN